MIDRPPGVGHNKAANPPKENQGDSTQGMGNGCQALQKPLTLTLPSFNSISWRKVGSENSIQS